MFCPECGSEMEIISEYPDTGTSVDFWEEKCPNGHRFVVERENQTGEKKLTAIEDVDEEGGNKRKMAEEKPIKLSDEDRKRLVELYRTAQTTPMIALSSKDALEGRDLATSAWNDVRTFMDSLGKKYGFNSVISAIDPETGIVSKRLKKEVKKKMKVEIDDVKIRELKKGMEKAGYDLPKTEEGWADVVNDLLDEKITEDYGEVLTDEPQSHNCAENIKIDDVFDFIGDDTVIFYGECKVCGRKLSQKFTYEDTTDRDTGQLIDRLHGRLFGRQIPAYCLRFLGVGKGDYVEWRNNAFIRGKKVVELRKCVENEDSDSGDEKFIHADDWREMSENDIISSIDVGLTVLHEKATVKEHTGQLILLIEEIAKMLAREV